MTQPIIGQHLTSTEGLKPGDLVRAIESDDVGLTQGKTYPVVNLDDARWVRVLDDEGEVSSWFPRRFTYVGPAGTRYVGEQVTVTDAKGKRGPGEVVGVSDSGAFSVCVGWPHDTKGAHRVGGHEWSFSPNETTCYGLTLDFKPFEEEATGGIEALLEELRQSEGIAITIFGDNPDFNGQPNSAVEVVADWTNWQTVRFTGDTLADALRNARPGAKGMIMAERMTLRRLEAEETQPTPITDPQKLVEGATYDVVWRGRFDGHSPNERRSIWTIEGYTNFFSAAGFAASAFRSATLVEDKPWKVGDLAVWPDTIPRDVDVIHGGRAYYEKADGPLAGGVPLSDLRRPGQ